MKQVLFFFLFNLMFLVGYAQDLKTKEINQCTIDIPDTWEMVTSRSNKDSISTRKASVYIENVASWRSPILQREDIPNNISVNIINYSRIDKKEISVDDVYNTFYKPIIKEKEIVEKTPALEGEKNFYIIQHSKNHNGDPVKYFSSYLFKTIENKVFLLKINASYDTYVKNKSLVEGIGESFQPL